MTATLHLINTLSLVLLGFALSVAVVVYLITARRRAATVQSLVEKLSREVEQHRECEERYRSLIENAPDAIITLDIEGRLASANPVYSTLTGLPLEACLGKPFWTLIHKDDLPKARAAFAITLRGEKPLVIELRVLKKSGDCILMEFTVMPQFHSRQVCGVLAIGRDVSVRNQKERAQAPLATPTILQGGNRHVLFVDDERNLAEHGQSALERLGYRVTTAADANEALAAIRSAPEKFDCLVTDLAMPGMSGIDLARLCQHLLPGTPVILMSGYSNATDTGFLRSHGIHELVLKPFTRQTLADALQRALAEGKDVPPA